MRKLILKSFYGLGDTVLFTAAVRDLHRCYPGRFITDVRTTCGELWNHNPNLRHLNERSRDVEVLECHMPLLRWANQIPYHILLTFIDNLNEQLGLEIKCTEFKGEIFFSSREKSEPSLVSALAGEKLPFWIIVAGGKHDITIKWWDADRYQKVVDHFRGRVQFVQVGNIGDYHPNLTGVIDLRGKLSVRELARLVYHAQGVLCGVTGLMHLAAAVEPNPDLAALRPCVVVAGGREPAHFEAYSNHQFIHTVGALRCCATGGCWKMRTLPLGDGHLYDHPNQLCVDVTNNLPRCMDMISAAEVIRRVEIFFERGSIKFLNRRQAAAGKRAVRATRQSMIDTRGRAVGVHRCEAGRPPRVRKPREIAPEQNGRAVVKQPFIGSRLARNGKLPNAVFTSRRPISLSAKRRSRKSDFSLITLHDSKMAAVGRVTSGLLREYADVHGYKLIYHRKLIDASRHPAWNKILALRAALDDPGRGWIMWIDADAVVMNHRIPAEGLIPPNVDMVFASDFNGLNSGIFMVRHCEWCRDFLDAVLFLGDLNHDPDGMGPKWEQNTIKHVLKNFENLSDRVALLPERSMNSCMNSFETGDFILHLGALSNRRRIRILKDARDWIVR